MCNRPKLTLSQYARLTGANPCSLAGFDGCFDCARRNQHIQAILSAESMAHDWLYNRHGSVLFDTPLTISTYRPQFYLAPRQSVVVQRTVTADAELDVEAVESCTDLVELTVAVPELAEGETVVRIEAVTTDCNCLAFGVEWCDWEITEGEDGFVLTAHAHAYNFVDYTEPIMADGTATYLESISICFVIEGEAVPKAIYEPNPGCCDSEPCEAVESSGCLMPIGERMYAGRDFSPCPTSCYGNPARYTLSVLRRGVWSDAVARAIVSWANTLMPQEACDGCGSGQMTSGWHRDTAINPTDIAPYGEYFAKRVLTGAVELTAVGGL